MAMIRYRNMGPGSLEILLEDSVMSLLLNINHRLFILFYCYGLLLAKYSYPWIISISFKSKIQVLVARNEREILQPVRYGSVELLQIGCLDGWYAINQPVDARDR